MGSIKFGNASFSNIYYGSTPVKSVYYGSTLVWGQAAPVAEDSISLSRTSLTFTGDGDLSQFVTVTASGTWTHSSVPQWITFTISGNRFTISCSRNTGSTSRTAAITFYCGSASAFLSITQETGTYVSLSTNRLDFLADGGSSTITVSSSGTWTCTKDANATWLSCSSMSGSNGDTITITCTDNNSINDRSTILSFTCGTASTGLGVNQVAGLVPSDPESLPAN